MGTTLPITPNYCPICEHNSIQPVTHRGIVNLYRCGEGHFFTFDGEPQEKQHENQSGKAQSSVLRVLVVDDSETVRRGLSQILQSQADIEIVGEASDGGEAVRKALEQKPDVVLLDITMPVMNGFDAARRISGELPSSLILMVSQFDSAPFATEAFAAGAHGYIVKSNAARELVPTLRHLRSRRTGARVPTTYDKK